MTQIVADDLQNDEVSSLVECMTAMSSGQVTQHKKIIEITGGIIGFLAVRQYSREHGRAFLAHA